MAFDKETKLWMSGNEAIALGAWEAGVRVASGYPGTPSTEIMGNLSRYEGVYTEWAPNEKVGLEVAIGASFAGARALATMKHVGMNVAADPLFTVTRGNPSPEELAALVAVLGALPEPQDAPPAHPRRAPRHQSRRLRLGLRLRPGRGAWRWTQPEG